MDNETLMDAVLGALHTDWIEDEPVYLWEGQMDYGDWGEPSYFSVYVEEEGITEAHHQVYLNFKDHMDEWFEAAYQKVTEHFRTDHEMYGLEPEHVAEIQGLLDAGRGQEVLSEPHLVIHPAQDGRLAFAIAFGFSMLDDEHGTAVRFLDGEAMDVCDLSMVDEPATE